MFFGGDFTITVKAEDNSGAQASTSFKVTVFGKIIIIYPPPDDPIIWEPLPYEEPYQEPIFGGRELTGTR